jgi:hypothetical protein
MSTQTATESQGRRSRVGDDGRTTATRRTFTETKNGFKTSEFYVMVLFVAGVLIAAYATGEDALARDDGWLFASLAVVSYIASRGLAKLATREPYEDRDR